MLKPLTVWITTNWKTLEELGIPDRLTCLMRNPYASQEETVRTQHGTTDWFKIGNGVHQGYILSPCWVLVSASESHSVVTYSLQPRGLSSPWNSPGQNTGVRSRSLLQGIFPTRDRTRVSHIAAEKPGKSLLLNLYVEYIMQNARLDDAHDWIKIARRNINNLI